MRLGSTWICPPRAIAQVAGRPGVGAGLLPAAPGFFETGRWMLPHFGWLPACIHPRGVAAVVCKPTPKTSRKEAFGGDSMCAESSVHFSQLRAERIPASNDVHYRDRLSRLIWERPSDTFAAKAVLVMERETSLELVTSTLEGWCSTN